MLHGYQAGAAYWFPHPLPRLSAEHHVLAPDLPGFGRSGPMAEYSLAAYTQVLSRFLDKLNVERVNLLGHSMGGQVAIALAATHPERINKLVLVDSAGLPLPKPLWGMPLRMLADRSSLYFGLYPTLMRLSARMRAGREGIRMLVQEPITSSLRALTMPTLVVWGAQDRIVPLKYGRQLAKGIANSRLVVISGTGHLPFYGAPQRFAGHILTFLRAETPRRRAK